MIFNLLIHQLIVEKLRFILYKLGYKQRPDLSLNLNQVEDLWLDVQFKGSSKSVVIGFIFTPILSYMIFKIN